MRPPRWRRAHVRSLGRSRLRRSFGYDRDTSNDYISSLFSISFGQRLHSGNKRASGIDHLSSTLVPGLAEPRASLRAPNTAMCRHQLPRESSLTRPSPPSRSSPAQCGYGPSDGWVGRLLTASSTSHCALDASKSVRVTRRLPGVLGPRKISSASGVPADRRLAERFHSSAAITARHTGVIHRFFIYYSRQLLNFS